MHRALFYFLRVDVQINRKQWEIYFRVCVELALSARAASAYFPADSRARVHAQTKRLGV